MSYSTPFVIVENERCKMSFVRQWVYITVIHNTQYKPLVCHKGTQSQLHHCFAFTCFSSSHKHVYIILQ